MRIFSPVVEPPSDILAIFVSDHHHGSTIGLQTVRYDHMRLPISLHRFAQKLHCCMAIPALGHIGFQHFTLVIDGAISNEFRRLSSQKPRPDATANGPRHASVRRAFCGSLRQTSAQTGSTRTALFRGKDRSRARGVNLRHSEAKVENGHTS